MTLEELSHMRKLRAIPAHPVVLTADSEVHTFCAKNDLPVIWTPALDEESDLRPLYGLEVWIVNVPVEIRDRIAQIPRTALWKCASRYGFEHKVSTIIGRAIQCKS